MKAEKTFAYQANLPSLPIPPLFETAEKYLRSVRPLLTDEEYARSQVCGLGPLPYSPRMLLLISCNQAVLVMNCTGAWKNTEKKSKRRAKVGLKIGGWSTGTFGL